MSFSARIAGIVALATLPSLIPPIASPAEAATVNVTADFRDAAGASMWTVDFSYNDALSAGTIGYADLTALQVNTGRSIYDLAFLAGTTMSPYLAFAYDTLAQSFRATSILGYAPLASAIADDFYSGFYISDYGMGGLSHVLRDYTGAAPEEYASSLQITQRIAAVPLPAAGFLLIGALGGLGLLRRKRAAVAA